MKFLTSTTRFAWFAILLLSAVPLTSHAQNAANDPMGLQDIQGSSGAVFPLSVLVGVGNSVGLGTFMPDYQRMPSWGSSVSMALLWRLPAAGAMPSSIVSVGSAASVPWLYAFNSGGNANLNQALVSDTRLNYRVPSLWRSAEWGLNVGAGAGMSLPTSLRSRYNNLGSALRVALPVAFFKAGFSAFWNTSLGYNVYTRANPLTQRMYSEEDSSRFLIVCRPAEVLGDDMCLRMGRPTDFTMANTFSVGYGFQRHNINIGLTWWLGFQRALTEAPELKSEFASDQNFNESVIGSISYGYAFEGAYAPGMGISMSTGQSPYTPTGEPRFGFLDLLTPSSNLTQFGLNLTWRL